MKQSELVPELLEAGDGKVFVAREGTFIEGGMLFKASLNGEEIGTLGTQEFIVGQCRKGENVISVNGTYLTKLTMSSDRVQFQCDQSKNHYFYVSIQRNFFRSDELEIVETTEGGVRTQAQD